MYSALGVDRRSVRRFGICDNRAFAINANASLRDQPDRFRIDAVFFDKHARGEGIRRVAWHDRHRRLKDDRSVVHGRTHEVDRAACEFLTRLDGALMGVQPLISRQ